MTSLGRPSSAPSPQTQATVLLPEWLSVVPRAIDSHGLTLQLENPKSTAALYKSQGLFCDAHSRISENLERMVAEAFIDDLYDGDLHLLTLRDRSNSNFACGAVYWRDVATEEMEEWMVPSHPAAKKLLDPVPDAGHVHSKPALPIDASSVEAKRVPEGLGSPKTGAATAAGAAASGDAKSPSSPTSSSQAPQTELVVPERLRALTRDWIKIELLCTHPKYAGRRVGSLLLAACLLYAAQHRKTKSILHVAGGAQNVPALRLYKRFGFAEAPSGLFSQPNKDLLVLTDSFSALRKLQWQEMLAPKMAAAAAAARGDSKGVAVAVETKALKSGAGSPVAAADTASSMDTTDDAGLETAVVHGMSRLALSGSGGAAPSAAGAGQGSGKRW